MRIIFMGTPDFAAKSLDLLYRSGHNIVGVITNEDKMGGRGKKQIIESAVKKYCVEKKINILQPKNLKNTQFIESLKALKADLQIVVAFRMLPVVVWDMPRYGTYNLHGSLLPKYRGAAPINWAIINGDKETGVTSFKLKHEIDTGDLLFQRKMRIYEDDNAEDLHDRMSILAAQVVLKTANYIELKSNDIELIIQDDSLASKAPKIFNKDCNVDFNLKGTDVYNFIRGMSPYPTAWTLLNGKKIKLFNTSFIKVNHDMEIGTYATDNQTYLKYACTNGYINIKELQIEGKRRMKIRTFLNGVKI